jgi:hypothetical protein
MIQGHVVDHVSKDMWKTTSARTRGRNLWTSAKIIPRKCEGERFEIVEARTTEANWSRRSTRGHVSLDCKLQVKRLKGSQARRNEI